MSESTGKFQLPTIEDLLQWKPEIVSGNQTFAILTLPSMDGIRDDLNFQFMSSASMFEVDRNEYYLRFSDGKKVRLLTLRSESSDVYEKSLITSSLARRPLTLGEDAQIRSVRGAILNVRPDGFLSPISLEHTKATVTIEADNKAGDKFEDAKRTDTSRVKVGTFFLKPTEEHLCLKEVNEVLFEVQRFFRFVFSADVSLGPWKGWDKESQLCALQPITSLVSPPITRPNWALFHSWTQVSEVFSLYHSAIQSEKMKQLLDRSFELYRTATLARESASIGTGIIVAQSLLELVSDFVVQEYAGWSEKFAGSVREFHNKLSASSAAIGFRGELFEHCPGLELKYSSRQPVSQFNLLTMIRNDLTHARRKTQLDGLELLHAWNATMFLAELHLLFLLNYDGKIKDRRILGGWFGETIDNPLFNKS